MSEFLLDTRENIIITIDQVKQYTDFLNFRLLPCDSKNASLQCSNESDFVDFMTEESAFVQFFWIDHHVVTNQEYLHLNMLDAQKSEEAYQVLPRQNVHNQHITSLDNQLIIKMEY